MKPFTVVSAVVMFVIALAHLVRVILRVPVVAGTTDIPVWPSGLIFVALVFLGIMLLREARR